MADGPILVTGAAGFIGFHVAQRLLRDGRDVVGLDNMNAYYDPALKEARRRRAGEIWPFRVSIKLDLADRDAMASCSPSIVFRMWFILQLKRACAIRSIDPHAYVIPT